MRSLSFRGWNLIAVLLAAAACSPDVSAPDIRPDAGIVTGGADGGTIDGPVGPLADGAVDAAPVDVRAGCETEVCGDGLDNDCDGMIDNGCDCTPGALEPCFSGDPTARNVGLCADGVAACVADTAGEFAHWGDCQGETLPAAEACDNDLVDENCNGQSNEGCACLPGEVQPCGNDEGECVAGTQTCDNGQWGACEGAVGPGTEVCDNLDNNCDGQIDENLFQTCGSNVGACSPGQSQCVAGVYGDCMGGRGPVDELCDGVDNDCNGIIDDGLVIACGLSDVGECQMGTSTCVDGAFGPCVGEIDPKPEVCDNKDNDCNNLSDDGVTQQCGTTDMGDCQYGTSTCAAGAFGPCVGNIEPTSEVCDGVHDEDCDGKVDNGCACVDGSTVPCGVSGTSPCKLGTQTCSGGAYGPCVGNIDPTSEVCGNGIDEDCNGSDLSCGSPPVVTCSAGITAQVLQTVSVSGSGSDPDGGTVTYRWTVTSAPAGSTAQPASPTNPTTSFFLDFAGTYVLTLTVTDDEGMTASCTVTITSQAPLGLHVELAWDTIYGDVDLHLIRASVPPAGAWFTGNDTFFANTPARWPPNGGAGDSSLDIDNTNGSGPENINIDNSPQTGNYEVGIQYFCQHSLNTKGGHPMTLNPGDGPTHATVKIFCNGVQVAEYDNISLDRSGRFVDVASVPWPGCTTGTAPTQHLTQDSTTLVEPSTYRTAYKNLPDYWHCLLPCNGNNDCGNGEHCATSGTYTGYCVVN